MLQSILSITYDATIYLAIPLYLIVREVTVTKISRWLCNLLSLQIKCQIILFLQNLCEDIRNLDAATISKLMIARSRVDNKPIVSCFMTELKQFLEVSVLSSQNISYMYVIV